MNKFINRYSIANNVHAIDGNTTIIPLQTASEEEVNFLRISENGNRFDSDPTGQFTVVGEDFDGTIFFARTPQEALIINQVTGKTVIVYYLEKNIKPVLDEIYNSGCPNRSVVLIDRSKASSLESIKSICSSYSLVSVFAHSSCENIAELSVELGFAAVTSAVLEIESGSSVKKKGPQINFTRVTDLGDIKGTDWIIDEIIQEKGFTNIFGPSGEHKSFVALDMACCVATGQEFHGRKTSKTGVIYICGEGEDGINARIRAWQKHNGHTGDIDVFMTSDPVRMLNEGYKDALVTSVKELEAATGIKIGAAIVDTMNRAFGDGDENNTRDMTMFTDACIDLRRETGMSVILVHHTSTSNPRQARGNGSLKASLETEINVLNPRDEEGNKLAFVELNVTKQKNGREIDPMYFVTKTIELGNDLKGRPVSSLVLLSGGVVNAKIAEALEESKSKEKTPKRAPKVKINLQKKLEEQEVCGYNGMTSNEKLMVNIIKIFGGNVSVDKVRAEISKNKLLMPHAKEVMQSLIKSNTVRIENGIVILNK